MISVGAGIAHPSFELGLSDAKLGLAPHGAFAVPICVFFTEYGAPSRGRV